MFNIWVSQIFPTLGKVFGVLSCISMESTNHVIEFFLNQYNLVATNLFTGEQFAIDHLFSIALAPNFLRPLLDFILPWGDLPFFCAVVMSSLTAYLLIVLVRALVRPFLPW